MEANQILLTPVALDNLLSQIKAIVAGAVKEHQTTELKQMLLSPAETCKLFSPEISRVTLHEWTKQGLIPAYRMGGRVYYNYGEVIESAKRIKKYDRDKQVK
jgi:hypothetical protein